MMGCNLAAKVNANRHYWPMYVLAGIFLIKALYLAFFVTPLWDIFDETGHFAYIRDIATGDGIPLLGEAEIGADIRADVNKVDDIRPMKNWIAQHPPLYHMIAAVPTAVGIFLDVGYPELYKVPRIVAPVAGALLLLVLFRTGLLLGVGPYKAMAISGAIGFVPMFTHLASGTNHDIPLFLASAIATYYFIQFYLTKIIRYAYISAIWLAVAGGMKMTAWVLIPPFMGFMALELSGPAKTWIKNLFFLSLTAISLPAVWMTRNLYYFDNPLYTAAINAPWRMDEPLQVDYLSYFGSNPVLELFFRYFYGLIGWNGTGEGTTAMVKLGGVPLMAFSVLSFVFCSMITLYLLRVLVSWEGENRDGRGGFGLINHISGLLNHRGVHYAWRLLVLFAAVAIAVNLYALSFEGVTWSSFRASVFCLLVFSCIASTLLIFQYTESADSRRLFAYCLLGFLFFAIILSTQVYDRFLAAGRLKAIHGRYFYPALPLLFVAFYIAVKRLRVPVYMLSGSTVILAYFELESYLIQVLPFYWGH